MDEHQGRLAGISAEQAPRSSVDRGTWDVMKEGSAKSYIMVMEPGR